jgi:cytidylate kinase
MNIIEAYIKFKGQLIIIIAGLSGCGKNKLAENISKDFKLTWIKTSDFCNNSYSKKIDLDGEEIDDYDDDNIIDWDKFNQEITKQLEKNKGLVISGVNFPKEKITFDINFYIFIKLNKQNILKRRLEFIKDHEKDCKKIGKNIEPEKEKRIFNLVTYNYYENIMANELINKYINANNFMDNQETYDEKIYDETFDYLINIIEQFVYNK